MTEPPTPDEPEAPAEQPAAPPPGPPPGYPPPYYGPPPGWQPVQRVPWVNPARRSHVLAAAGVAALVALGAGFGIGWAAAPGGGGHGPGMRIERGYPGGPGPYGPHPNRPFPGKLPTATPTPTK